VLYTHRGVTWGGGVAPRAESEYFKRKKLYFLRLADFKLLNQIQEHLINNSGVLKFVISLRGRYFHLSPRELKTATPLLIHTARSYSTAYTYCT
jgi:hypothetical protein